MQESLIEIENEFWKRGAKELFTGELLLREGLINWILKEGNEI